MRAGWIIPCSICSGYLDFCRTFPQIQGNGEVVQPETRSLSSTTSHSLLRAIDFLFLHSLLMRCAHVRKHEGTRMGEVRLMRRTWPFRIAWRRQWNLGPQ